MSALVCLQDHGGGCVAGEVRPIFLFPWQRLKDDKCGRRNEGWLSAAVVAFEQESELQFFFVALAAELLLC